MFNKLRKQGRRKMFQVRGPNAEGARTVQVDPGACSPGNFLIFDCILWSVLDFKILVYLYFLRQYLTFLETSYTWLHWPVCETCVRASATCPRNFLKYICSEVTSGAI